MTPLYLRISVVALAISSLAGGVPVRAAMLSDNDQRIYREAFAAADKDHWADAWRLSVRAQDPLLGIALRWLDLTRDGGDMSFADYTAFIAKHPDWPNQKSLLVRAESTIAAVPDSALSEWFTHHPPLTPAAQLRQAEMWREAGREAEGVERIRQVWIDGDFTTFEEKTLLQRYHGELRMVDHAKRLDRLLWDGQTDGARHLLRILSADYQALGEARLALQASSPGVERLVALVPASLQRDPGLLYDRLRWRVHKEMNDAAIEILNNPPADLVRPAAWATERQILARRLLADSNAQGAYALATHHGLTSGPAFSELEFLAGWIALRSLHKPDVAYNHFVALYQGVAMPISAARGAYWAARAADAMGYKQLEMAWYAAAAEHTTTFYGGLAAAQFGTDATRLAAVTEPEPTRDEANAYDRRELVRVVRELGEIGAKDEIRPFVRQLSDAAKTPTDYVLTARLAAALDRPDLAVATAKKAGYAGVPLVEEGYPVADLPSAGGSAERPLVLAMARQESAFDREAVSPVGARGLMQLMPSTAVRLAKALAMPFSASRLTTDPRYNVTLGRAYVDNLLDDFSGSYVLAIAAYNAGPARVREWISSYGDPRSKSVDVVDWVESIPFTETRNYVQRVLENLQVYRYRLGDRKLAFSVANDLKR